MLINTPKQHGYAVHYVRTTIHEARTEGVRYILKPFGSASQDPEANLTNQTNDADFSALTKRFPDHAIDLDCFVAFAALHSNLRRFLVHLIS